MGSIIAAAMALVLGALAFRSGKREGSKKGYHVGRKHEKQSRRKWGRK